MNQFLSLNEAWQNKKQIDIDECYKNQVDKISFNPKLRNKIDTVQIIAVSVMTINVAIPCTAFPVTNPIIYRKITKKLNSHEIDRFLNKLRMKFFY